MTQKRAEHNGADKFRVTVELVHVIHHWFKHGVRPVGKMDKALVVLTGKHGTLSNIDNNHRFKETKICMVNGKPVVHEKGQWTRLVYNLVELRNNMQGGEIMEVMQQPSRFVEKIIMKWHLEIQSERCVCSLAQRDLFTGA